MLRSKTRWEILQADDRQIHRLAQESGVHPLIARLCWLRGIQTPEEIHAFLNIEHTAFYDPFMLKGMKEAVERIQRAINQSEKILIYGDYDADGVSSTTIMINLMKMLKANIDYYIPDRFSEGYGLNQDALIRAAEAGFDLIITVDTGISAVQEVKKANELGIDIIITDHHEPPEILPEAYTIINPKLKDCTYPFPFLAGAGVALKVAQALLGEVPDEWIGVCAIGTIADLVPLLGENRLIAYRGLQILSKTRNHGIQALLKESSIDNITLDAYHVGFAIGPRINAGGRLERANIGVRLLTTEDPVEAKQLAAHLNQLNVQRQELVQTIAEEAIAQAEVSISEGYTHVLVVCGEDWNEGVIGIVASKLVERFYRPTIVFSLDAHTGIAKGSARSIEGFDLYQNLSQCKDLLLKYGGHTMAAGMSISKENIQQLRIQLNHQAKRILSAEELIPKSKIDLVCTIQDITIPFLEQIAKLAPFGTLNPEPLIVISDGTISFMRRVGKEGNHLKCVFQQGDASLDGIGFHMGSIIELLSSNAKIQLVGELGINEWNGHRKPQILLKDMKVEHLQIFDKRGIRDRIKGIESVPRIGKTVVLYFRNANRKYMDVIEELGFIPLAVSKIGNPLVTMKYQALEDTEQIILFDCPETFASLGIFRYFKHIERIWCLFGEELNESTLSRMPTRDAFKWVYSYFYKHNRSSLDQAFWEYIKGKGVSPLEVELILAVFIDLHFINKEEEVYQIVKQPEKKEIEASAVYQMAKERMRVETEFVFSSVNDLYIRITQYMKKMDEDDYKEAVIS